jgi:hypothetical protein
MDKGIHKGQMSIFPDEDPNSLLNINHCSFLGVHYTFFSDLVGFIQKEVGLIDLAQPMLQDLVTIRLFEPASKLLSIELLEDYLASNTPEKVTTK